MSALIEQIEAALTAQGLRHAVNRIEDSNGEVVVWAGGMGHPVSSVERAVELAAHFADGPTGEVFEEGGFWRWRITTPDGTEYLDGGNYLSEEAARAGLEGALAALRGES